MRTITLKVPDNLGIDNLQFLMIVASKLYAQGKLSLGQAAELAGLSKRTFTELLGNYEVSVFNYTAEDLSKDIANA